MGRSVPLLNHEDRTPTEIEVRSGGTHLDTHQDSLAVNDLLSAVPLAHPFVGDSISQIAITVRPAY